MEVASQQFLVDCSGLDFTKMAVLLEYIPESMIGFGFLGPNFLNLSLSVGQNNNTSMTDLAWWC